MDASTTGSGAALMQLAPVPVADLAEEERRQASDQGIVSDIEDVRLHLPIALVSKSTARLMDLAAVIVFKREVICDAATRPLAITQQGFDLSLPFGA